MLKRKQATRVRHHCRKCGFAEKMRVRDYLALSFQSLCFAVGLAILLSLAISYAFGTVSLAEFLLDHGLSASVTRYARENQDIMRDYALNFTSECRSPSVYCYSRTIFEHVEDVRYEYPSLYEIMYDPEYVLHEGGDCKNSAAMYVALMHSVGFDAWVDCSVRNYHCVAVVPLKPAYARAYEEVAVIDLTMGHYAYYSSVDEFWRKS